MCFVCVEIVFCDAGVRTRFRMDFRMIFCKRATKQKQCQTGVFCPPFFIFLQPGPPQIQQNLCQRPYRVECTGSLPNSEVKRRRARLVLGWGTAREDLRVLLAFCFRIPTVRLHPFVGSFLVKTAQATYACASGHTASKAPDLFRTPKLSGAGPG